ncbi:chitobiosyldiphosphodolichol beta-mannosyltransferase-like isoform X3 [Centruroides vittatus]|uniref:chitobiosyldiphosphodolichol beta-mannosyltransferase-like isoform X3 n=1 Tax=Centruroides vittatus TaxID=120091 RepID=UPI00350EBA69
MSTENIPKKRICVVVLDDFGRSPRMQFHALSLADNNFIVDVVCYRDSIPYEQVMNNSSIHQHILKEPPKFGQCIPQFFVYMLKVLWQFLVLLNMLISLPKPSCVFIQNPPSIPTLPVVWLYCCFFEIKWIIDWHNYGHTILRLKHGPDHILVKIYLWAEFYFGRKATYNFCVTEAMKNDLLQNWNIRAEVLYDRPAPMFQPTNLQDKHSLLLKLENDYPILKSWGIATTNEQTNFTEIIDGTVNEKSNRPALIVSSTSWTEDEDFDILLEALQGKGPLQFQFLSLITKKNFQHVVIITPWLAAEDYPKLLGSADLGVCLHISSSGLDLPMKIVDMFGCKLPVCAVSYKCLDELVKVGENGLMFKDAKELASQLQDLLKNPRNHSRLETFRDNLRRRDQRWESCWNTTALKFFQ